MDISESCLDEERTVTMIEDIVETDETVVNNSQHAHSPEDCAQEPNNLSPLMQSKKVEDNTEVIIKTMKTALDKLTTLDGLEEFVSLQSRSRYLVSQEKLVELVGSTCCEQTDGQKCDAQLSFHSKVVGSSLELTWYCKSGHGRKWVSSETLPSKKRGTIAINDGLLASAVIISGNNYSKFSLLCQALGMQIISEASFLRFQKHCAAPVIEEVWLSRYLKIMKKSVCVGMDEMIPLATVLGIVFTPWLNTLLVLWLISQLSIKGDWWQFHYNGEGGPKETVGKAGCWISIPGINYRCFTSSN